MKGLLSVFAVSMLLLVGCEPAAVSESSSERRSSAGLSLALDRMKSPEGAEIIFNGRIFQYQLLQNARGEFDRYIIHSTDSLMGMEGAVFAQLAKAGYTRRIRAEVPGRFIVNYLKKGGVTIVATYTDHVGTIAGAPVKSRAVLTWKVAG